MCLLVVQHQEIYIMLKYISISFGFFFFGGGGGGGGADAKLGNFKP